MGSPRLGGRPAASSSCARSSRTYSGALAMHVCYTDRQVLGGSNLTLKLLLLVLLLLLLLLLKKSGKLHLLLLLLVCSLQLRSIWRRNLRSNQLLLHSTQLGGRADVLGAQVCIGVVAAGIRSLLVVTHGRVLTVDAASGRVRSVTPGLSVGLLHALDEAKKISVLGNQNLVNALRNACRTGIAGDMVFCDNAQVVKIGCDDAHIRATGLGEGSEQVVVVVGTETKQVLQKERGVAKRSVLQRGHQSGSQQVGQLLVSFCCRRTYLRATNVGCRVEVWCVKTCVLSIINFAILNNNKRFIIAYLDSNIDLQASNVTCQI